jgi:hypothetical protein
MHSRYGFTTSEEQALHTLVALNNLRRRNALQPRPEDSEYFLRQLDIRGVIRGIWEDYAQANYLPNPQVLKLALGNGFELVNSVSRWFPFIMHTHLEFTFGIASTHDRIIQHPDILFLNELEYSSISETSLAILHQTIERELEEPVALIKTGRHEVDYMAEMVRKRKSSIKEGSIP